MRKRILALFMALVMCLSLLPTAAFAEGIASDGDAADSDGTTITGTTTTGDSTGAPTGGDATGAPADSDATGGDATGDTDSDTTDSDTTDTDTDTTDTNDDTGDASDGDTTDTDSDTADSTDTTDTDATDTDSEGESGNDSDIPVVQSAPLLGASSSRSAQTGVAYDDGYGNKYTCNEYTEINGNLPAEAWQAPKYINEKWYVVKGADVKITEEVDVDGFRVMLILCDGAKLTFEKGFRGSIIIYGQEEGTGQLVAQGGSNSGLRGYITIRGGTVTATSNDKGIYGTAAITKGKLIAQGGSVGFWGFGDMSVDGGEVEISGGDTGLYISRHNVTVNGGKVSISGGTGLHLCGSKLTVNGGTLTATALRPDGWGILSSEYTGTYRPTASSMTVNGGTMIAKNPASVVSGSTGGAINREHLWVDTFTAQCWWRTADGETEYHSQNVEYTDNDLVDTYFEVTCEKPKNVKSEPPVTYTDEKGSYQTCTEYIKVKDRGGDVAWGNDGKTTWYYLSENATLLGGTLTIRGDVKLILADRKTLTVADCYEFMGGDDVGLRIGGGSSLTIYGVAEMTGEMNVTADQTSGKDYAIHIDGGKLTINGGRVSATGGWSNVGPKGASAGIYISGNGELIVNRGTLSATGGKVMNSGAGQEDNYSVGIYMACANAVTINGGRVIAEGGYSPDDSFGSFAVAGNQ